MPRPRSPLLALGSVLWLAACSVELGSQGDIVAIDSPPPAVVATPAAAPASPSLPASPSAGNPAAGAGGVGALADAGSGLGVPSGAGATVADAGPPREQDAGGMAVLPFTLGSPDFAAGAELPELHTCQGGDQSPAFVWQGAPADTKSFALVLTTHTAFLGSNIDYQRWVMWNIPATRSTLPAGIDEGHSPGDVPGAVQASNETDSNLGGGNLGGGSIGGGSIGGGSIGGGNLGGGNLGGGNPGGWAGGTFGGGTTAGAGGSFAGGSGDDARQGRRYRGPCSYGLPQTFDFVLYALADSPEPPSWELGITPDEIVEWLTTEATVLGTARLEGVAP